MPNFRRVVDVAVVPSTSEAIGPVVEERVKDVRTWVVSNEIQHRWVAPILAVIYQTFQEMRSPKYCQYVCQKNDRQSVTQLESFLI